MADLAIMNVEVAGSAHDLLITDGSIAAITAPSGGAPTADHIDGAGLAVLPGLINAHTHSAMTLLRGYGDDLPLMEWLEQRIWPAEQHLTPEDVYWGTRLAAIEMLRSGTTACFDMYWYGVETARALQDAGMRGVVAGALWDFHDASRTSAAIASAAADLEAIAAIGPLVQPSLGPHAVYTCSEHLLRETARLAAETGVIVQTHCSETADEVAQSLATFGRRPVRVLADAGLLTERTLLAHGCYLDDEDRRIIADTGATVVTNPVSNCKLAGGQIFDYPAARASGVHVGLGTDGAASNNSLDLLGDLKTFALLQRHAAIDPAVIPVPEVLSLAFGAHSPALRPDPGITLGQPADLVLVNRRAPELAIGDLDANLVYAASGSVVHTVVIAGETVVADRVVRDEAEILAECQARAARLRASA
jgi:5-methylthioadenosine/S-adenosylhomocysteine deaminase